MPCSEDTIYYIKTDTPHLSDCSFFGPFKSLEAAVPSIRKNLYQTSLPGLDTFDELMSASPNGLTSLQHFAAPLRDGGVMMIHIVKEQNAEVAATLPGPAWVVVCSELVIPPSAPKGVPKVKDLTICQTFVSAEKANQAVRRIATQKLQGMRGGRQFEIMNSDGTISCGVTSPTEVWAVEAKWESGIVRPSNLPNGNTAIQSGPSCSTCHKPQSTLANPLRRCSRCLIPHYCSKECQKSDWKSHKHNCLPPGSAPPPTT
jgi:hypothetical protein